MLQSADAPSPTEPESGGTEIPVPAVDSVDLPIPTPQLDLPVPE
jgi:hypothetical protein